MALIRKRCASVPPRGRERIAERDRQQEHLERTDHIFIRLVGCLSGAIADPEHPYRYPSVRGEAVEHREEGTREHLETRAERYIGESKYPGPGGDQRVALVVRADDGSEQSPPSRDV